MIILVIGSDNRCPEKEFQLSDTLCPKGWKAYNLSCFYLSHTLDTWFGAQTQCANLVASPTNSGQSQFQQLVSAGEFEPPPLAHFLMPSLATIGDGFQQAVLNWMVEDTFPTESEKLLAFWTGLNSLEVRWCD